MSFNKLVLFSSLLAFIVVNHSANAHYTGISFNGIGFNYTCTHEGRIPMRCWACNNSPLHIRFWQKYINILFIFNILPFGKKEYIFYCPNCSLSLPIKDQWLEKVLAMLVLEELTLDNPLKLTETNPLKNAPTV